MSRITKFQTSSLRIGPFEGALLFRVLIGSLLILLTIFFLGFYGILSVAILPIFTIKIQHDFLDEYIFKAIRGVTVTDIIPLIPVTSTCYEIFCSNYGFSEKQDELILETWSSIVRSFSEDMLIIRHPYQIPTKRFVRENKEYNSLFSEMDSSADAYFIVINSRCVDEFERTLSDHGVPFEKLGREEVMALNDLI